MNDGEVVAVLASAVQYQLNALDRLFESVREVGNAEITPERLNQLFGENQGHVVFVALQTFGVLIPLTAAPHILRARINNAELLRLQDYLRIHIVATNTANHQTPESTAIELAWTLPKGLHISNAPSNQSLAALIRHTIALAEKSLVLISPFLDDLGIEILLGPLKGAHDRGVQIRLISHDLDIPSSYNFQALEKLRYTVPSIQAFTALPGQAGNYQLLHAKLVIADGRYAVLSSANLTQYGLKSHLEIGAGISGSSAETLERLAMAIISSGLVQRC